MQKDILEKLIRYIMKERRYVNYDSLVTQLNTAYTWALFFFRIFIGEPKYRGSLVFRDYIKDDRELKEINDEKTSKDRVIDIVYPIFKKWFCKNFAKTECTELDISKFQGKQCRFFSFTSPAGVNKSAHYIGVRLFKDHITVFDPADTSNPGWCGEVVIRVIRKVARDFNIEVKKFNVKCQFEFDDDKNPDVFCQTWTLMWEKKISVCPIKQTRVEQVARNKAARDILLPEKRKKKEDKQSLEKLHKFIIELLQYELGQKFNDFIITGYDITKMPRYKFFLKLYKKYKPSEIILKSSNENLHEYGLTEADKVEAKRLFDVVTAEQSAAREKLQQEKRQREEKKARPRADRAEARKKKRAKYPAPPSGSSINGGRRRLTKKKTRKKKTKKRRKRKKKKKTRRKKS
jgi:hypothetical protein